MLEYTKGLIISMGGLLFGHFFVLINPYQEIIQSQYNWSDDEKNENIGKLNSILPLGAVIGAYISQYAYRYMFKRQQMIIADIITLITTLIQIKTMNFNTFLYTRLIQGVTVGFNSSIIPQYLKNLNEESNSIGTFQQLMITGGMLFTFILSASFPNNYTETSYFATIICLLRIILLLIFLENKNYQEQNNKTLNHLEQQSLSTNDDQNDDNLDSAKQSQKCANNKTNNNKSLVIAILIASANQFCGMNIITFYSSQLLGNYKNSLNMQNLQSKMFLFIFQKISHILMAGIQVMSTLVSSLIINMYGHRSLILGGCLMLISILGGLVVGNFFELFAINLLCLLFFVFCFGFTLGPVTWVVIPTLVDSKNVSRITTLIWVYTISIAYTFPILQEEMPLYLIFLTFGLILGVCLLALIFTYDISYDDTYVVEVQDKQDIQNDPNEDNEEEMHDMDSYQDNDHHSDDQDDPEKEYFNKENEEHFI